jgi:hypothetical protein
MEKDDDKAAARLALEIERKALLQLQLDEDFREIMNTKGGRRFIWHAMAECLVFQPVYHVEASVMYLREGKRQIGLNYLVKIQSICPHQYQVMAMENATNPIED